MKLIKKEWLVCGLYTLVALAILAPLLLPGFILTLDMVFTPHLAMPDHITSSYLFHATLHILNTVIPSEIIEKVILLAILLLSMIGLHRLVRELPYPQRDGEWGIYIASVFFAVNPFTYSRFMAGQYAVLLGYALLPWLARLLLVFGRRPQLRGALKLGGLLTIIGIVSIHTLGLAAVLVMIAGLLGCRRRAHWASYIRFGGTAVVLALILSSYWMVPLLAGKGSTAQTISSFTVADTQAFATTGGNPAAQAGNVIRLQGFWAEGRGLYLLPQERVVLWGLLSLMIIGAAITGAVVVARHSRTPAILLGASAVIGLVLATGLLTPLLRHMPLLAGYREPQKFAGLLALGYATFLGIGIDMLLRHARERHEALYAAGAVVALVIPFLYMRVMFWGFDGQLSPRHYPAEWSTVNSMLSRDKDTFTTVFLPWHQYMSFSFAGRIIANPAPSFFDKPVTVSIDPEIAGASGGVQTAQQHAIDQTIKTHSTQTFASDLAAQHVKYILLAKGFDTDTYDFMQQAPQLTHIASYPALDVYQNNAWSPQ